MKQEILYVRSLEDYLEKAIQPILKNPKTLKVGKSFTTIKLRPREVLGAFLVCAVIRHISNQYWILARDPEGGDGAILCMDPSRMFEGAFLEQVYVPRRTEKIPASIEEIIERVKGEIQRKYEKGRVYAQNKHLVVFLDIEGLLDYQKIKDFVNQLDERFDSYWLFAPLSKQRKQFKYLVILLRAERDEPAAYTVKIDIDFRGWEVKRLGRL